MVEQITIDEKYAYQFDSGSVQLLRDNLPWLDSRDASLTAPKAWIAAAGEIERLRQQLEHFKTELADAQLRTPCQECNAEPGEECRPYCIGAAQHADEELEQDNSNG